MGGKRYPVAFVDIDAQGEKLEDRELPAEEWPGDGDYISIGRRNPMRVCQVVKHYGVKGLLRLEVRLTRKSLTEAARLSLGSKAAERVKKG